MTDNQSKKLNEVKAVKETMVILGLIALFAYSTIGLTAYLYSVNKDNVTNNPHSKWSPSSKGEHHG